MKRYTLIVKRRKHDSNLEQDEIIRSCKILEEQRFDSLEDLEDHVLQTYSQMFRRLSVRRMYETFESEFSIKLRTRILRKEQTLKDTSKAELIHKEILTTAQYEFYIIVDEVEESIDLNESSENDENLKKTYVVTDIAIDEEYDAISQDSYTTLGEVKTFLFDKIDEVKEYLEQFEHSIKAHPLEDKESNFYQSKEILSYSKGLYSERHVYLQIIKTKKKG